MQRFLHQDNPDPIDTDTLEVLQRAGRTQNGINQAINNTSAPNFFPEQDRPKTTDVELTPTQIKLNDEFQQIIKSLKKDEKE